jgi:hypothetical protein
MGNREGGTCSVGNFRTSRCSVAPSSCNKSFRIVISGPLNTEGSFMSFQTCKSFVDPDCYTKSVRLYIAMYGKQSPASVKQCVADLGIANLPT